MEDPEPLGTCLVMCLGARPMSDGEVIDDHHVTFPVVMRPHELRRLEKLVVTIEELGHLRLVEEPQLLNLAIHPRHTC